MFEDSGNPIDKISEELRKDNEGQGLIFEVLEGFNPVLNSELAHENIEKENIFMSFMTNAVDNIVTFIKEIHKSLKGNSLQEDEDRTEMLTALSKLGREDDPFASVQEKKLGAGDFSSTKAGIIAGLTSSLTSKFGMLMPAGILTAFLPLKKFFLSFLTFGKTILRFAGPVGIAISTIMALVGGIKGAMKGFEEDDIIGAIKGAVIGAVDGLIGSILQGIAGAIDWVLKAFGFESLTGKLGPVFQGFLDDIFKSFGGWVDIIAGIFTLDSDRIIDGIMAVVDVAFKWIMGLGDLFIWLVKNIVPLIGKAIKAIFWDLPIFIAKVVKFGWKFFTEDFPEVIAKVWERLKVFFSEFSEKFQSDLKPFLIEKRAELTEWISDRFSIFLTKIGEWFSETFTWENVSAGFTGVKEFIVSVRDRVWGFIKDVFTGFLEMFSNIGESVAESFSGLASWRDELNRKILKGVLPPRTDDTKWNDPMHWVAKAIPDSVYAFAGMPTKAGTGLNDATGGVNPFERKAKARLAGYDSWEDYEKSGWKWKGPKLESIPPTSGNMLNEAGKSSMNAPVIINQNGGNVSNTTMSSVNTTNASYDQIMTGSALGFASV
jgi:hypothetical protein